MLSLSLGIRLQHWLKIPLITHWHDNRCPDDLIPLLNAHRQHPIICVSQAVQTTLENTAPVALSLKTIYNGIAHTQYQNKPTKAIACQQLGIPEHPVYVGFLGRLTEGKGVHILIEALAQLPDTIHLIIAGTWDGDTYKTKIQHQIDAFGLGSRVHRVGFQPTRTVLAASYCLAIPSETESFSLCTLEAMAAEVPVIAHAVGGIPEQITHNQTGLLITKNIAREWASAIQYLYDNPDQHQSLATAGQHSAQRFDIQTMTRSIEAVYASLAP
jgi:glycosyltransferase involved in cell wall biosynthesis